MLIITVLFILFWGLFGIGVGWALWENFKRDTAIFAGILMWPFYLAYYLMKHLFYGKHY